MRFAAVVFEMILVFPSLVLYGARLFDVTNDP